MRFQCKTLPQIIRLKTNRYQAEGLSYYGALLDGIRLNFDKIPTFAPIILQVPCLTPVRYVDYPEEQAPPRSLFLSRLSRVGTTCQFMYDFMEVKGIAIRYFGVR